MTHNELQENLLISVVIPMYNGEKYIIECLDSVFDQTYKNYEVIIVDDQSTDCSLELIQNYPAPITVIKQIHGDVNKARNAGIENAHGELIAFLDQDDLWLPEKLQRQVALFRQKPEIDLVYSDMEKVYDSGSRRKQRDKTRISRKINKRDPFPILARKNLIAPSAVMMKKSVFSQIGLFDVTFTTCGDWEFWLRMTCHGFKFWFLDDVTVLYRYHTSNTSQSAQLMHDDRIKALYKIFNDGDLPNRYKKLKSECLARAYFLAANNFYTIGDKTKFSELFLTAWRLNKRVVPWKALRRFIRERLTVANHR